ncbi:hypothetical protein PF005_g11866 [Phytophthora fragariae]|uniref:Uncharacterized protein n=1 Tax=Phytophthora fragariae TaxID=53985 RepID=A0A6A3TY58_9STRA|nr:hypothetical protein PF003_g26576 [Phytophthora fragariae]KAE8947629.1 hypothetical protein PF009_g2783 [Phytophthora fragariae]KAE8983320.1 hypothetical protein PF011_g21237 [Phytophthora fragariae]KAE9104993.1 hypothetical protein PF007_g13850 [Phytophthora fragariae]KAE9105063.1 hypothetical protein PF010_g13153 [Phytophthora fragariae]
MLLSRTYSPLEQVVELLRMEADGECWRCLRRGSRTMETNARRCRWAMWREGVRSHGLTRHTKRSHRRPFECVKSLEIFKKKNELQTRSVYSEQERGRRDLLRRGRAQEPQGSKTEQPTSSAAHVCLMSD